MPVSLDLAVAALREGRIVGVPTDTVYGIAADPFCEAAVRALFSAKGRPVVKPIPILAADTEQIMNVGVLDEGARALAADYWPGALTLVVPRVDGLPEWVGDAGRGSVGVRMPDHPAALALLAASGPLAVTSANRTGDPPAGDDRAARASLGDVVAVYLEGSGGGGAASTVVDMTGPEPRVLRPGPVELPGI